MAEFCKQCAEELDFEPDFTGMFERDNDKPDGGKHGYYVLCETCGPACFIIDDAGTCGSHDCDGSIQDNGAPHGDNS